jgi:hypothetical protein
MRYVRAFGVFLYDFVVGDDWLLALGVVVGLAVTAVLAHSGAARAWWVLPACVVVVLALSLRRARRISKAKAAGTAPPQQ